MPKIKIYTWGKSQEFVRVDKSIYMQFLQDYRTQNAIEQNAFMDWVDTYDFSLCDKDVPFQEKLQPCMIARKYVGCEKHEFYILKSWRKKYKKNEVLQNINIQKEYEKTMQILKEIVNNICHSIVQLLLEQNKLNANVIKDNFICNSQGAEISCKGNLDSLQKDNITSYTKIGDKNKNEIL